MCVFMFENNVLCCWRSLNPTWGPSSLFSLIDWTDWWSALWSSQKNKYWPSPWNPTTRDSTGAETVSVHESERDVSWKPLLWFNLLQAQPSTSSVCAAKISVCLCVYGLLPAWLQGLWVNQSTLILYTSSTDGCPRLLVDTVYSCFQSADSSNPEQGGSAVPAADMSRFQREQNKSP